MLACKLAMHLQPPNLHFISVILEKLYEKNTQIGNISINSLEAAQLIK